MSAPKVYIVASRPEAQYHGDIAGELRTADGELLWGHLSSSVGWLKNDLTGPMASRKYELERMYPDGYEVVWLGPGDDRPWKQVQR